MRRTKIVKLLILVVAVVLLTAVLHAPIATLLTEPLTRLWWLVDSLPQRLTWTVLAVLGFALAIALGRKSRLPAQKSTPARSCPYTEVERLTKLIELGNRSVWARDVLARRLCETAAGLQALREGVLRGQAREEILAGRWPADRSVSEVLQPQHKKPGGHYAHELAEALDSLERYAREGEL